MRRAQDRAGGSDRNLNAGWDVVDDAYGFAVGVSRQRVRDDVVLHLPGRLVARLHAVDGFTGGTLQAEGQRANPEVQQLPAAGPLCPRLVYQSTAVGSTWKAEV